LLPADEKSGWFCVPNVEKNIVFFFTDQKLFFGVSGTTPFSISLLQAASAKHRFHKQGVFEVKINCFWL
jgi:hypothetical protein